MKRPLNIPILRLDILAISFLVIAVAGSFFGEGIFRLFGLYENRNYNRTPYLGLFFTMLAVLLIAFTLLLGQHPCTENRIQQHPISAGEANLTARLLNLFMILMLPFQAGYLRFLYVETLNVGNFDIARTNLQDSTLVIPKFFFYGSFFFGMALALAWIRPKFPGRRLMLWAMIGQGLALVLYGSKSLFLLSGLSAVATVHLYRGIRLTWKRIGMLSVAFIGLLVLATIYTNLRSWGTGIGDNLVVETMATFMPEQRDGAYLMSEYGTIRKDPAYLKDNTIIGVASLTHRRIFEKVFNIDIERRINKKYIFKDMLGYTWDGGTARIGLIADSYLLGGDLGAICILGSYIVGLVMIAWYIYFVPKGFANNYFGILIFINFLWSFNSDYITQLPFVFTIVYTNLLFFLATRILEYRNLEFKIKSANASSDD